MKICKSPMWAPHAQGVLNTPEKDKGYVDTGMIRLAD